MHYSNLEGILLVGEGDFSFSSVLAKALGSAFNIIATSLDSRGFNFLFSCISQFHFTACLCSLFFGLIDYKPLQFVLVCGF